MSGLDIKLWHSRKWTISHKSLGYQRIAFRNIENYKVQDWVLGTTQSTLSPLLYLWLDLAPSIKDCEVCAVRQACVVGADRIERWFSLSITSCTSLPTFLDLCTFVGLTNLRRCGTDFGSRMLLDTSRPVSCKHLKACNQRSSTSPGWMLLVACRPVSFYAADRACAQVRMGLGFCPLSVACRPMQARLAVCDRAVQVLSCQRGI